MCKEYEIEYEDGNDSLKVSLTFNEYSEFYKMFKRNEYIIEPLNDIKGLMLSDFSYCGDDFLFSEDSFNAAEYFEILRDDSK